MFAQVLCSTSDSERSPSGLRALVKRRRFGIRMTRCVRLWQGHTVKELLRRLKAQFPRDGGGGDGPLSRAGLDLAALGVAAAWHFRSAPSVHCILGPLDARVKARAKQKPRVRQRLADQVRPVDVQVGLP